MTATKRQFTSISVKELLNQPVDEAEGLGRKMHVGADIGDQGQKLIQRQEPLLLSINTRIFEGPRRRAHSCPPAPMQILAWNCRGLGNKDTVNFLIRLIKTHTPSCGLLSETKGNMEQIERVVKKLGFDHAEIVKARGKSGGLLWLWNGEVDIDVAWKTDNVVCCTIHNCNNQDCWHLYGAYGPPHYVKKKRFWEDMAEKISNEEMPWMMFGDLNEIIDETERFGGRNLIGKRLFLKEFMQQVGAVDLGFNGRKFTWINKQGGSANIRR